MQELQAPQYVPELQSQAVKRSRRNLSFDEFRLTFITSRNDV